MKEVTLPVFHAYVSHPYSVSIPEDSLNVYISFWMFLNFFSRRYVLHRWYNWWWCWVYRVQITTSVHCSGRLVSEPRPTTPLCQPYHTSGSCVQPSGRPCTSTPTGPCRDRVLQATVYTWRWVKVSRVGRQVCGALARVRLDCVSSVNVPSSTKMITMMMMMMKSSLLTDYRHCLTVT